MRWALVDDLFLIVHRPVDPDPSDWNKLMELGRPSMERVRRVLVSSADAKLTAKQRGELGDFVKNYDCKVAVMADSPITRGVVTALGWVTGKYQAFASDDIERALAYLGSQVPPARVREEIFGMRKEMGQIRAAAG